MVRVQGCLLQLREKVTFLMLITKFTCQTKLFPESLKGQKEGKWKRKKEEESSRLKGERWDEDDNAERGDGKRTLSAWTSHLLFLLETLKLV